MVYLPWAVESSNLECLTIRTSWFQLYIYLKNQSHSQVLHCVKVHELYDSKISFATILPAHIPAFHNVMTGHLFSRRIKQSHFPLKLVKHIHRVIHIHLHIFFVKQGHGIRGTKCFPLCSDTPTSMFLLYAFFELYLTHHKLGGETYRQHHQYLKQKPWFLQQI